MMNDDRFPIVARDFFFPASVTLAISGHKYDSMTVIDSMRFLARYSIGTKLLMTPVLVTLLLLLVAAAAWYGMRAHHAALERIYEIRFQRLSATNQGLNDVRSVNEDVYVVLADYQQALADGDTEFEDLKEPAEAIRQGLAQASYDFESAALKPDLTEGEQAAYQDVLIAITGYGEAIAPLLQTLTGETSRHNESQITMAWNWFGSFLTAARRLNEIQDDLSAADYGIAKRIASSSSVALGGVVLLAILISAGCALTIRAQIVGAIHGIRDAALQLQSGDLCGRAHVVGRDEVAQSAQAFNQLVEGFQNLVKQVLGSARELAASARSLTSDAHEVQRDAARQSEAIEAVAATMDNMSVSITVVAEGAEQVRANSLQSLQGSQEGRLALESMREETDRVHAAFTEIQTSVEDFLERTAAIADLTQRVKEIAGQTNLLALNAAIEAARAGEQGRGFAVVADEVRKLAEDSSGAASHIEQVAAALETRSKAVGRSLEAGHQSLESTLHQLSRLLHIITNAGEAVATTTHEIDGIVEAVKKQSSGSADVVRNVDEIVRMSAQNAHTVTQTAGAAVQLEQLADGLESAVAHFRV